MTNEVLSKITDDTPMSQKALKGFSLLFLLIATSMTLFTYSQEGILWDTKLNIYPSFISAIIAICLIVPLYARNILKWNKSVYTLISFVFFLLLFSSLITLAMGGSGFNSKVVQYVLITSIILSWLGMKAIAGVSWLLLFVAVIYSIVENNMAMGFYGFIYISCGFIGLVLHTDLNPGNLMKDIKEEFIVSSDIVNHVKDDINASVDIAKTATAVV
ncbi:hypothetical protein L5F50_01245 [Aliarcobacter butzleri]|nr:hypothetical protein [Aliarcobacter butzleri]